VASKGGKNGKYVLRRKKGGEPTSQRAGCEKSSEGKRDLEKGFWVGTEKKTVFPNPPLINISAGGDREELGCEVKKKAQRGNRRDIKKVSSKLEEGHPSLSRWPKKILWEGRRGKSGENHHRTSLK